MLKSWFGKLKVKYSSWFLHLLDFLSFFFFFFDWGKLGKKQRISSLALKLCSPYASWFSWRCLWKKFLSRWEEHSSEGCKLTLKEVVLLFVWFLCKIFGLCILFPCFKIEVQHKKALEEDTEFMIKWKGKLFILWASWREKGILILCFYIRLKEADLDGSWEHLRKKIAN